MRLMSKLTIHRYVKWPHHLYKLLLAQTANLFDVKLLMIVS
jgi:hypothetical protein